MNRNDQMCIPLKNTIWLGIYCVTKWETEGDGVYISLNAYVQFPLKLISIAQEQVASQV